LIRRAGVPIAAPSANVFGHISPTAAAHVLADLDGRIDAVLDAGPTLHGVESTVLDPNRSPMIVYRPGAITLEQIRAIGGPVRPFETAQPVSAAPREGLPSPGVGLRHYAPKARIVLVESESPGLGQRLAGEVKKASHEYVGLLLPGGIHIPDLTPATIVFNWGDWSAPEEMAHLLYAGLRELDSQGCTVIVCPIPPEQGIGAAIRDRLLKAAAKAEGK
jgi:L-threonylcarbamoyladenylate synthase